MMLLNHRRAVELAAGTLVATVVLFAMVGFDVTRAAVQPVDDAWLDAMQAVRVAPLEALAKVLDVAGGTWVTWPVRLAVALWLLFRRRWAHLGALALAVAVSEVGIGVFKALIARPRPPGLLVHVTGFSFPSGHATAAAVTAIALVVVLLPPGPSRWRWEVRAMLFVLAMALSRTYLGAHWLSDAVAGTLFGTAVVLASVVVVIGLRNRLRPRWFPEPARSAAPSPPPAGATSTGGTTPGR
jgi:membrane-associated phospholipid phosphatase